MTEKSASEKNIETFQLTAHEIVILRNRLSVLEAVPPPPVNALYTRVLDGPAAAGQSIWGNTGHTTTIEWDATVHDADRVEFLNGNRVRFKETGDARVYAAALSNEGTANNRTTYFSRIIHYAADDTVKDVYYTNSLYVRDDANTYDKGGLSEQVGFSVELGDYIEYEIEVIGEATATGTQSIDTNKSGIKVDLAPLISVPLATFGIFTI